jgi:polyisoprenoid-binding protein YceI
MLLATTICYAEPTAYTADQAVSSVAFTGSQEGLAFTGSFSDFSARIVFDPENLAASSITANVATASADTNNNDRDTLLVGNDWLASMLWPTATFASTSISTADIAGQLIATGNLTLRDVTREVQLTFSLTEVAEQPQTRRFSGSMNVQRLSFGVGQGDWADTRWVANDVVITIDLLLVPE